MAEYSRLAKGHFTATGGVVPVYLPFQPDYVELVNYTAAATPTAGFIPYASWDAQMGQGYGVYSVFATTGTSPATPYLSTLVTTSGGVSTFSAGISLQYGPQLQIASTTKGSTTTITTASPHGLVTGDVVILEGLYQSATTGMAQMSGMPFYVTYSSSTAFTVNWNSNNSSYTNLSASPAGAYVRKVLYPFLYAPGVSFVSAITTGTTTTITTTAPHNLVAGQEIAFRIPSAWGTTELNSLPNTLVPGSPVYGYVTSVSSATVFVCNINSTSYTAFTTAVGITSVPGLTPPQVVAVGDVNTGGVAYSGGNLYPSPVVNGVSTINGPAISGAYVNNTRQGFLVGATLAPTVSQVVYWRAFLHDYST